MRIPGHGEVKVDSTNNQLEAAISPRALFAGAFRSLELVSRQSLISLGDT